MKQLIAPRVATSPGGEAATARSDPPLIRPYHPCDADRVRGMALSRKSLYERFFSGTPRLPQHYLRRLDRADHNDHEVVVAVVGREVVGLAEYVREAGTPQTAHLAVMVADAWQRRGVGRRMVNVLADLARARGITELCADVLVTNRAAVAAINSLWPCHEPAGAEGGTAAFRLPL